MSEIIVIDGRNTFKDMYVHYNPVRSFHIEEQDRNKKGRDEVNVIKLNTVYAMEK